MNFKKATDELIASVTLEDLADVLGVSVQAVRQARAAQESSGHRPPPEGWELGVKMAAERRIRELKGLVKYMKV